MTEMYTGTNALAGLRRAAPTSRHLAAVPLIPERTDDLVRPLWVEVDYVASGIDGGSAEKLADSAVAPLVAAARGYETVHETELPEALKRFRLPRQTSGQGQRVANAVANGDLLIMPWYTADDLAIAARHDRTPVHTTIQFRPTRPEADDKGRERKYEFVGGQKTPVGLHPAYPREWIDQAPVVLIAEGLLKGDSALTGYLLHHGVTAEELAWNGGTVDEARAALQTLLERVAPKDRVLTLTIGGVDNWKNNNEWRDLELRDRVTWIGVDGDVATNFNVHRAASELWDYLKTKKRAKPALIAPSIKATDGEKKVGIDDYLAKYGNWAGLVGMVADALPSQPAKKQTAAEKAADAAATSFIFDFGRVSDVPDPAVCEETATYALTFLGLGERVERHFGKWIAWCPEIKAFRVFTGTHWVNDPDRVHVNSYVFATMRAITVHEAAYAESKNEAVIDAQRKVDVAKAGGLDSAQYEAELAAARKAARKAIELFGLRVEDAKGAADRAIEHLKTKTIKTPDVWDRHELLVNAPNGTYHVGKREFREHRPEDHITRLTGVRIDLAAPVTPDVEQVLKHVDRQFASSNDGESQALDKPVDEQTDDRESDGSGRKMLLRWLGMCLTRLTDAKSIMAVTGPKNAAKSTVFESFFVASGGLNEDSSYGAILSPASMEKRSTRNGAGHTDALDSLASCTWVFMDECQDYYLDTEKLKTLSAGGFEKTSAKGKSNRTWRSHLKFVTAANGQFKFPAQDDAFLWRLLPIDFHVSIPAGEKDEQLKHRLMHDEANLVSLLSVSLNAASDWYQEYQEGRSAGVRDAAREALALPKGLDDVRANFGAMANPLLGWLEDRAILGDEAELQAEYGQYGKADTATWLRYYNSTCALYGRKSLAEDKFAELLNALGHTLTNPTDVTYTDAAGSRKLHMKNKRIRTGMRFSIDKDWWQFLIDYHHRT